MTLVPTSLDKGLPKEHLAQRSTDAETVDRARKDAEPKVAKRGRDDNYITAPCDPATANAVPKPTATQLHRPDGPCHRFRCRMYSVMQIYTAKVLEKTAK